LLFIHIINDLSVDTLFEYKLLLVNTIMLLGVKELGMLCQGLVVHFYEANTHALYALSIHAILAIEELEDSVPGCSYGGVVLDLDIFQGLDQAPLDVTSLGGLTGGINQTLSATHGVEVKFLRGQTIYVAVGDEAFTLRPKIILTEVRQGSTVEAKCDTLSFHILLANTSHDL
jgi:hypothetical protein